MTTADLITEFATDVKNAYDAVEEMGGTLPENKNAENLPDAIASIPQQTSPPYDPENPTLTGIKAAINAGDYAAFPVGTEIPDTYDGNSNPLIVAKYLNSANNASYGGAVGAILIRKYVEPTSQMFSSRNSSDYRTSSVRAFLQTTYLDKCSDDLKNVISDISVQWTNYVGETDTTYMITDKWFLMSDREVYSNHSYRIEGIAWDYWEQNIASSSPTSGATAGRVRKDASGTICPWWLRSYYGAQSNCGVTRTGEVSHSVSNSIYLGVLPACFIAKDN